MDKEDHNPALSFHHTHRRWDTTDKSLITEALGFLEIVNNIEMTESSTTLYYAHTPAPYIA
jgi:hypothetical protein